MVSKYSQLISDLKTHFNLEPGSAKNPMGNLVFIVDDCFVSLAICCFSFWCARLAKKLKCRDALNFFGCY